MANNKKKEIAFTIKQGDKYKTELIAILLFLLLFMLPLSPFMLRHNPIFWYYAYCIFIFCCIVSILRWRFLKGSKRVLLQIDDEGVSIAVTNDVLNLSWDEIESISIRQVVVIDNIITNISWDTIKTTDNKSIRKQARKMNNVLFIKPIGQDELGLSLDPYTVLFLSHSRVRKIRNIVSEHKSDPNCFSCNVPPYWKELLMYWSVLLKRK